MKRITKVKALENYKLDIQFADGTSGVADVSGLVSKGVFSLWEDFEEFRKVEIGPTGELIWKEQIDLCPDALYMNITGKRPEDVFPSLKPKVARA
ncbi:MAG: DUF2442 domain-containing protein [Candidatus Bipolaricaulota bacterium]|nr:DUF2442 domain-containing protein [Candidatus Bipolaricaulota bacterium]